eukprot:15457395-Alexandrium_andersonii.AAC.1
MSSWWHWLRRRGIATALGVAFVWCFPIALAGDLAVRVAMLGGFSPTRAVALGRTTMSVLTVMLLTAVTLACVITSYCLPPPPALAQPILVKIEIPHSACAAAWAAAQACSALAMALL